MKSQPEPKPQPIAKLAAKVITESRRTKRHREEAERTERTPESDRNSRLLSEYWPG